MDDLLDIFKVFKFSRRLANFKSMSLWQKILTVVGSLGLLLTGVLAAMLALRPFADALIYVPQSEADVVIALRESSDMLTLTASN